jgi:hypothetical protein
MELAAHKATHFPRFRSLSLLENVDSMYYFHQEFSPPEVLRMAFEENSIAFHGVCRVLKTRYREHFQ